MPHHDQYAFTVPIADDGHWYLFNGESMLFAEVTQDVHDHVVLAKAGVDVAPSPRVEHLNALHFFQGPDHRVATQGAGVGMVLEEAYLLLTDRCNLACRYCFNGSDLPLIRGKVMSPSVLEAAVRFLAHAAHPERGLRLILWGGEPLLDYRTLHMALTCATQAFRTANKPLTFATTTNAIALDARVAETLVEFNVVVNFSLDGTPDSHNLYRTHRDGRPSHADTMRGVHTYLDVQRRRAPTMLPRARMTVTHDSASRFYENVVSLWAAGIPYVWAKDVAWQPDGHPAMLDDSDIPVLEEQYRLLRMHILRAMAHGDAERVLPQLVADLGALHRRERRKGSCGAGHGNVSITTSGDIIACYHLEGSDAFRLGHVDQATECLECIRQMRTTVDDDEVCRSCEYKYLCGGGCAAKGIGKGLGARSCWVGQCKFIKVSLMHLLRLYGSVMSGAGGARLAPLLRRPDRLPRAVVSGESGA
mgnify:CR=1 FL=1